MASDDSWLGRTLAGRYSLLRRIGSGGMSTVYAATDEQLGRNVAVKLFPAGEARDDSRRRAEVDVLARLNHPNLVTMYDAHLASGDSSVPSFLVMELVAGPDLRSTLDHGPLLGGVAARVAADIAGGLAAMHAQGIVHRDLKPANILLAPTGLPSPTHRAKLADFGIAHLVGADRMTTVGTVIGTASYLSPEQATGAAPGPASDIYALGLVVLEGLTGRREYPGTIVESMSARASRDPVISDALPAGWVALLTEMTARDPDARPSALDVAARAQHLAPELEAWGGFAAGAGG
ncbi:serine/threonine protein kinase, partial [Subtercola sp. Z020]|uniref:serine/threonine-protein kinase n=1 Tax=Subtercola sp. Z020 TaxID=2080582 RepID=UPI000D4D69D3